MVLNSNLGNFLLEQLFEPAWKKRNKLLHQYKMKGSD